ncbi:MAG: GWxTD domain-containing protein [Acidobacteriota bacterium]|nr:GWxTD domain-containing protein [Acidobacteriota bacterium]
MRHSSPSNRGEPGTRGRRAISQFLIPLAALLFCISDLSSRESEEPAFKVITRQGRTYASSRLPAVKKGYFFLTDPEGNFFSLPVESVNWSATRAANRQIATELLENWHEGPVRYLLTGPHVSEYRALQGDQDRLAWISRFWASLDATPDTFYNERRYIYWTRVRDANAQFTGSTKPGWKTDRGRIYLLLGPPDEVESFPMRSGNDARFDARYTQDAPAGYPRHTIPPRGVTRWTYRNIGIPGLDPHMIIAFRENSSGEYYLSSDAIDYDRVFRDMSSSISSLNLNTLDLGAGRNATGNSGAQSAQRMAESGRVGITQTSSLSLLSDLGKAQDVTRMEFWSTEVVQAREFFGVFPLQSVYHFYRSQEGLTYMEINLTLDLEAMPKSDSAAQPSRSAREPPLSLGGRLISESDPQFLVTFSSDDGFASLSLRDADEVRWIYQSGVGVPPGTYILLIAILEEKTGRAGSWKEIVEVPDLSEQGLLLSDLVLARDIQTRPEPSRTPFKEPFVHGQLKVIPQIDSTYRSNHNLAFYYQVYGAERDPNTRQPSLDLEYRFERIGKEDLPPVGASVRLEEQHDLSQAYSFPLDEWPEGSYLLTVEATDRIGGGTARRQAEFTVRH